jgi:hypothetical protein
MHARIALAAMLIVGFSSHAMAQSIGLNDGVAIAASQDGVTPALQLTPVSWRKSPRSTHSGVQRSRNAGLGTGAYVPWSGQQAPESGYAPRGWPADNYQYWHQACCQ